MKNFTRIFSVLLAVMMILTSFPAQTQAATVKLNKTKATIYVGSSITLKLTGTDKKITWKTSDQKVATVSSKGKVTAQKAGTTTITAKVGKKSYKCKVTVKKPYLSATKKTVYKGIGYTLELKGTSIASAKSSNTKVAKVDKNGKIIGLKKGTATITIKGKDGKSYICKVTVPDCPYPFDTIIDEGTEMHYYRMEEINSHATDKQKQIYAAFCKRAGMCYKGCKHEAIKSNISIWTPDVGYWNCKVIQSISFSIFRKEIPYLSVMEDGTGYINLKETKIKTIISNNPTIATATKDGIVTGKSVGKATFTIKGKNGKTYKWTVYVCEPHISTPYENLYKGTYFTLNMFGTDIVSATSSNTKVATVNKKGKVTAKKVGKTTITLKCKNGRSYKCVVNVKVRPKCKYPLYQLADKGKKVSWYYLNGDPYATDFRNETIKMFCKRHGVTEYDIGQDFKFMGYQIEPGVDVAKCTLTLK